MSKPIIAICSSANFYRQVLAVQGELAARGIEAIVPISALKMKETGNFDVDQHRTWLSDDNDYDKKTALMHTHLDEIDKADAILVVNFEKRGIPNYIGGNVLMEMAIAFHQRKPIFILNELPEESAFLEEIKGMQPTVLHGDAGKLPMQL